VSVESVEQLVLAVGVARAPEIVEARRARFADPLAAVPADVQLVAMHA
jgi:hypothetical protein